MILDAILSTLVFPGFIIGTLVVAAFLWWLGLRQPFLLAFGALVLGGGIGAWAETRVGRRKYRSPK
jgi:hypothetical protein